MATIIVPSNPVDRKTILDAIKEAADSLVRIDSERDQIKAIIEDLDEKFPDLGKKFLKRMMTVYHKQNFSLFESEAEDFVTLYTTVIGK